MARRLILTFGAAAAIAGAIGLRDRADFTATRAAASEALAIVTASVGGDGALERRIAALQASVRAGGRESATLERLGWAFVEKARMDGDPGFHKLAEQCAFVMRERRPGDPSALLLAGHAALSLHRFRDAEAIARALVALRGSPLDYALLGDALADRGELGQAIAAYRRMMRLRPDSKAHLRVAHVRYLTGDTEGAIEAMQVAVRATSTRDREALAWTLARLAFYELAAGRVVEARADAEAATQVHPGLAYALLVLGRIHLAEHDFDAAAAALQRSADLVPLPETLWLLAEAQRAAGRPDAAGLAESTLLSTGAGTDSRGLAAYLAASLRDPRRALALARAEIAQRRDAYTYDVLATAALAAGRVHRARRAMARALAAGTRDARLFYHAGLVAEATGADREAATWFAKARELAVALYPSERADLDRREGLKVAAVYDRTRRIP
jgi:tetratricopeptide (TPR) repeat protein